MKHGITAGVVGVAVIAAALAGCSSNKSTGRIELKLGRTGGSGWPAGHRRRSEPEHHRPGHLHRGRRQHQHRHRRCLKRGGAVVSNANPPIVHAVGLGTVNNVALGFSDAAPGQGGDAGAAQNGKTYAIKGTATGTDMSNPQQPQQVKKSFEMDVTCP